MQSDWIAQGFEIVQCPFPDWRFAVVDTIAACAVHGALVVGTPVHVSDIKDCAEKLRSFKIALYRDGRQQAAGLGSNVLGSPLLAFAHLTDVLSRQSRFPPVRAGEVISTGTLTDLFPVSPGETWSTTISGIELPGPVDRDRVRNSLVTHKRTPGRYLHRYVLSVMDDEPTRTADRLEAAKWLADRGFGKAALVIDAGVSPEHLLHDFLSRLSIEDLKTMKAILSKYSPDAAELAEAGELRLRAGPVGVPSPRR